MPITLSGLFVDFAICEIEIDEVFEASIVLLLQILSNCENISNLRSLFSVAASTTRSAS